MRQCNKWGEKFQSYGFRLTASRKVGLKVIINTDGHLSAEDIYMAVHLDNPSIGLTTIYRTLELLEQTGIVSKFKFGHGRAKYELSEEYSNKKHHHHLICKKCRKIVDYSDFVEEEKKYINKAVVGLQNKYGFEIDEHLIRFYGTCPDCQKW